MDPQHHELSFGAIRLEFGASVGFSPFATVVVHGPVSSHRRCEGSWCRWSALTGVLCHEGQLGVVRFPGGELERWGEAIPARRAWLSRWRCLDPAR